MAPRHSFSIIRSKTIHFAVASSTLLLLISCLPTKAGAPKAAPGATSKTQAAAETVPDIPVESLSPEESVKEISKSMRTAREATRKKNFTKSKSYLRRAEQAIKKAPIKTQGHPEFEDLEESLLRSQKSLNIAIEKDRIEKRNAAIDALIIKADSAISQLKVVAEELNSRSPENEDMARLGDILSILSSTRSDGRQFEDEERYRSHAHTRDKYAERLRTIYALTEWQLKLIADLKAPIEAAFEEIAKIEEAQSETRKGVLFLRVSEGFVACANTIADALSKSGANSAIKIDSRLGRISVADTRSQCIKQAGNARDRGNALKWAGAMLDMVSILNKNVGAWDEAQSPKKKLSLLEESRKSLKQCRKVIAHTLSAPGFKAKHPFDTILGKLSAASLDKKCKRELENMEKEESVWRWREQVEQIATMIAQVAQDKKRAAKIIKPKERLTAWRQIGGKYAECEERNRSLAEERHSDQRFKISTPWGNISSKTMGTRCEAAKVAARFEVANAEKDLKKEEFLKKVKGDEVALIQRNGVPIKVVDLEQGRVFYYSAEGKSRAKFRQFGFDKKGRRLDFSTAWRKNVQSDLAPIDSAVSRAHNAATAIERLEAAGQCKKLLKNCVELFSEATNGPGARLDATFETFWGELTVDSIGAACTKEAKLLKSGAKNESGWLNLNSSPTEPPALCRTLTQHLQILSPLVQPSFLGAPKVDLQSAPSKLRLSRKIFPVSIKKKKSLPYLASLIPRLLSANANLNSKKLISFPAKLCLSPKKSPLSQSVKATK